jgi:hypothetical protein
MKSNRISAISLVFSMFVVASSTSLAAEPAAPAASESGQNNLLKPANDVESWQLELSEGGEGKMEVEGDAIAFHVTKTTGTNWHVQAYQTGLDLKDGQQYVIKFKMKAVDSTEVLLIGLINQDDWHEIGLHEELMPTKDFTDYDFTFTASNVVKDSNRIGFVLGASSGIVTIKDLSLTAK